MEKQILVTSNKMHEVKRSNLNRPLLGKRSPIVLSANFRNQSPERRNQKRFGNELRNQILKIRRQNLNSRFWLWQIKFENMGGGDTKFPTYRICPTMYVELARHRAGAERQVTTHKHQILVSTN
jgi:hypothetical protein